MALQVHFTLYVASFFDVNDQIRSCLENASVRYHGEFFTFSQLRNRSHSFSALSI